jgi:hypothetical protein
LSIVRIAEGSRVGTLLEDPASKDALLKALDHHFTMV